MFYALLRSVESTQVAKIDPCRTEMNSWRDLLVVSYVQLLLVGTSYKRVYCCSLHLTEEGACETDLFIVRPSLAIIILCFAWWRSGRSKRSPWPRTDDDKNFRKTSVSGQAYIFHPKPSLSWIRLLLHFSHGRGRRWLPPSQVDRPTRGNLSFFRGKIYILLCCSVGRPAWMRSVGRSASTVFTANLSSGRPPDAWSLELAPFIRTKTEKR